MLKQATVDSVSHWLIACEPTGAVKLTVSRLSSVNEGLTRVEERRSLGATLRHKLEFEISGWTNAATAELIAAMRTPDNRPVLCPLWPAAVKAGSSLAYTSALKITWEPGFTAWQVHSGSSPTGWTPSAKAATAPLLVGRLDRRPEMGMDTTELYDAGLTFVESGPAEYAAAPGTAFQAGPTIHAETPPLLAFDVQVTSSKVATEIVIARERLGYGREETETFHPQVPRRTHSLTISGDAPAMMRLLAIFHACGGSVAPVWFPSGHHACRLTGNPSSASSVVAVDDGAAVAAHSFIVLRSATGVDVARSILSVAGNNVTLDSPPPTMNYVDVSLQHLLLGRFRSDELTITWTSAASFASQCAMVELPTEYADTAGEIYGTTHGELASTVWLLKVTDQIGGAWYWTNYEAAVTVGGQTWSPQPWAWTEVSRGVNLDDGELRLRMAAWAGNPFLRLVRPCRGQALTVELLEWDLVSASPMTIWSGVSRSVKFSGRILESTSKGIGAALMNQRVPRLLDGPSCSWIMYDGCCGLDPAAKAQVGWVAYSIGNLTMRVSCQGTPSYPAHHFAGGWLRREVPGNGSVTYAILDSSANDGTVVDVVLDTPFSNPPLTAYEQVTLYPGCDQSWAACLAFGNTGNFGGLPQKPAENPAFTAVKTNSGGNKK